MVRAAIEELQKLGVTAVSVPMPELLAALDGSSVINSEFKEDLANYLAKNGNAPVHSLEEIVQGGLYHSELEAVLNARLASKGRDSYEYKIALAKRSAMQQTILRLMEDQKLDVLVYPTMRRKPALITVPQGGSNCQLSATTGFPAISMPAGFTADGLPVGVELLGRAFDDAKLVSYAYAYEQADASSPRSFENAGSRRSDQYPADEVGNHGASLRRQRHGVWQIYVRSGDQRTHLRHHHRRLCGE